MVIGRVCKKCLSKYRNENAKKLYLNFDHFYCLSWFKLFFECSAVCEDFLGSEFEIDADEEFNFVLLLLILLLFTVNEDNGDVIVEMDDGSAGEVNVDKDDDEEDGDEFDDDTLRKFSNCSITLESNENKSNFNKLF